MSINPGYRAYRAQRTRHRPALTKLQQFSLGENSSLDRLSVFCSVQLSWPAHSTPLQTGEQHNTPSHICPGPGPPRIPCGHHYNNYGCLTHRVMLTLHCWKALFRFRLHEVSGEQRWLGRCFVPFDRPFRTIIQIYTLVAGL